MKKILIVILVLINGSFFTSCNSSDKKSEKVIVVKESDIVREKIGVNGMTCVGCEVTLEENISKIEGVVSVKASHTEKEAIIEFDSTKTDIKTISKTIKESGYKPYTYTIRSKKLKQHKAKSQEAYVLPTLKAERKIKIASR